MKKTPFCAFRGTADLSRPQNLIWDNELVNNSSDFKLSHDKQVIEVIEAGAYEVCAYLLFPRNSCSHIYLSCNKDVLSHSQDLGSQAISSFQINEVFILPANALLKIINNASPERPSVAYFSVRRVIE